MTVPSFKAYEAWKVHNDGNVEFSHTSLVVIQDEKLFAGRTNTRSSSITVDDFKNVVEIAPAEIYPPLSADCRRASDILLPTMYLKRPSLMTFELGADNSVIPKLLLEEASIYEVLSRHEPCLNIAQYRGCLSKQGLLYGIVLTKYECTLYERLRDTSQPKLDINRCLTDVSNGLKHLHNLGLAYNDLNAANVMYTADDTAVLIDLDSCRAEGESLDKWGTLDWIDAPLHISDTRNDRAALKKLETYLIAHK